MFGRRRPVTLIAEGSKIGGGISAEGIVEVNGTVEGDVDCASLFISKNGCVKGRVVAEGVIVSGLVEGPVNCSRLHLKSGARVIGDIRYDTLIVDQGGHFAGRSLEKKDPKKVQQARKEKAAAKSAEKGSSAKTRKASNSDGAAAPKMDGVGSASPA